MTSSNLTETGQIRTFIESSFVRRRRGGRVDVLQDPIPSSDTDDALRRTSSEDAAMLDDEPSARFAAERFGGDGISVETADGLLVDR